MFLSIDLIMFYIIFEIRLIPTLFFNYLYIEEEIMDNSEVNFSSSGKRWIATSINLFDSVLIDYAR